jgi:hypothetical protein
VRIVLKKESEIKLGGIYKEMDILDNFVLAYLSRKRG